MLNFDFLQKGLGIVSPECAELRASRAFVPYMPTCLCFLRAFLFLRTLRAFTFLKKCGPTQNQPEQAGISKSEEK